MTEHEDLKPGDVVQMKSGGPPMTVDFVDDAVVTATWFDGNEVRSRDFGRHLLGKYSIVV